MNIKSNKKISFERSKSNICLKHLNKNLTNHN